MNNHQYLDIAQEQITSTATHTTIRTANQQLGHNNANRDTALTENNTMQRENQQLTVQNQNHQYVIDTNVLQIDQNRTTTTDNVAIIATADAAIIDLTNNLREVGLIQPFLARMLVALIEDRLRADEPRINAIATGLGRPILRVIIRSVLSLMIVCPPPPEGYTNQAMAHAHGVNSSGESWQKAITAAEQFNYITRDVTRRPHRFHIHDSILHNLPIQARPIHDNDNRARFLNLVQQGRLRVAHNRRTPRRTQRDNNVTP
jgi:hypothetical protein